VQYQWYNFSSSLNIVKWYNISLSYFCFKLKAEFKNGNIVAVLLTVWAMVALLHNVNTNTIYDAVEFSFIEVCCIVTLYIWLTLHVMVTGCQPQRTEACQTFQLTHRGSHWKVVTPCGRIVNQMGTQALNCMPLLKRIRMFHNCWVSIMVVLSLSFIDLLI
jgi:hypothetical protein